MNFSAAAGASISGEPVYDRAEYSFRFEQLEVESGEERLIGDRTSLAIGTLQVEVNADSGVALFVWGYLPWFGWARRALKPPELRPGVVTAHVTGGFTAGVTKRLADVGVWTTAFDEDSGYVQISPDPTRADDQTVLIATRTSLGLVGDELNSIWIKPTFINSTPEDF